MPTAPILGASRGIGLEFARQYLESGWTVYATHRSKADRVKLRDMGANTLKLDVLDVAGSIAGMRRVISGRAQGDCAWHPDA